MNLEERAKAFATNAHAGQVRKYTNEPYINHPAAVVEIVRSVPHTPEMIAAAWLHDTVEDCDVALLDIIKEFGMEVASLVDHLTDKSKPSDGNRKIRKAIDQANLAKAPAAAQTIKLADLIDNTSSVVERDPSFAIVYLREKSALLDVMNKGDATLYARARAALQT